MLEICHNSRCGKIAVKNIQTGYYEKDSTIKVEKEYPSCAYCKEEMKEFVEERENAEFVRIV